MANIIDVAQEAGVSTGTVSKYINSTGYVSPQKRDRIKEAISKLNYIPNRAAKQLKECTTRDIAVVIPNLSEKKYTDLFEGISACVDKQYRLLLFLTNDISAIETQILNDCVSNNCLGIILCTCQPSNDNLLARISKLVPIVFAVREPDNKLSYNYIGFNDSQTIYSLTNQLLKLGINNIILYAGDSSFSNEHQCIISFEQAFRNHNLLLDNGRIYSYPASKDATFRNVMNLFNENRIPDVFITTSFITAQAIKEVAYFQNVNVGEDIQIISLAEATWHDSNFSNQTINTFRNFHELGRNAVQLLFNSINNPLFKEVQSLQLEDQFPCEKIQSYLKKQSRTNSENNNIRIIPKLRILLNEADSGTDAMKCLIPRFIQEENISVKIDTLPHPELYDYLSKSDEIAYDIVAVDAPWIPYLSTTGKLKDLTDFVNRSGLSYKMQDKVAEKISSFNNRLFGIPFVYTSSLLYYRKDLFNNDDLKAKFYQKYKRDLLPPTNWKEFSYIARFFTKKYNSISPTLYGTGIFGNFPSSMMTEFYPRMWSYGGSIMDRNGFVTLFSENNIKAMQNLSETIKCFYRLIMSVDSRTIMTQSNRTS